tara:strand:- start:1162 stop:1446 length:285 start_codon:yes stop_codon:yes gene_type:complete
MKRILMIAALSAALISPAFAQQALICAPPAKWKTDLKAKYGEVPVIAGMGGARPFLIFANLETGTWSMLGFKPGVACLVGAGTSFELIPLGDPA